MFKCLLLCAMCKKVFARLIFLNKEILLKGKIHRFLNVSYYPNYLEMAVSSVSMYNTKRAINVSC